MAFLEGPLSKWTNVMKGWQYRWFVLDENAGLLSYYTSKEKMMRGARRGCVRLKGAVIGIDDEDDSTFTITVDQKTFHFQARDVEEKEKWIDALETTIVRHTQAVQKWENRGGVTMADFDKRLAETDAYLQILIEQSKALDAKIATCDKEETKNQLCTVKTTTESMIETIKQTIVLLQISKQNHGTPPPPPQASSSGRSQAMMNGHRESEADTADVKLKVPPSPHPSTSNDAVNNAGPSSPSTSSSQQHRSRSSGCLPPRGEGATLEDVAAQPFSVSMPNLGSGGGGGLNRSNQESVSEVGGSPSSPSGPTPVSDVDGATARMVNEHSASSLSALTGDLSDSSSDEEDDFFDAEDGSSERKDEPPPVVIASKDDVYDELYDDIDDESLDSLDQHGSIITHLLSQVRIGMDLTKIVLPTFILERRSLLEMFADFLSHPDLFANIVDHQSPRDRMVQCTRWYLSAFHAGRRSSVAKKPYNPILGETFHCHYDLPQEEHTQTLVEDGPVPWATRNNVSFIAEQVSHHPPISAFYAEHFNKRISLDGYIWTKSKFLGLSIGVHMIGQAVISLPDWDEEYIITFPNGYGRSILTVPWIELGGKCTITCAKTGYNATIDFLTKPFYGGKKDQIQAEIYAPNEKKSFCTVKGEWNGVMYAKHTSGHNEVFVDTKSMPIVKKRVRPLDQQDEFESRRLWQDVTKQLKMKDVEAATTFKHALEQRQREEAKERKDTGAKIQNKYFSENGEHWLYNRPLVKRIST